MCETDEREPSRRGRSLGLDTRENGTAIYHTPPPLARYALRLSLIQGWAVRAGLNSQVGIQRGRLCIRTPPRLGLLVARGLVWAGRA
jgi:hypothetical protein